MPYYYVGFCDATAYTFTNISDVFLQNFRKMVEQSVDLHVEQLKKEGKRKKVEEGSKAKQGEEGGPPKKKKFFRDKSIKEEDAAARKEKKALKAAERKELKEKAEKQEKLARRAEKKQSKEGAEKAKKKEKTKSKFSISLSGGHTQQPAHIHIVINHKFQSDPTTSKVLIHQKRFLQVTLYANILCLLLISRQRSKDNYCQRKGGSKRGERGKYTTVERNKGIERNISGAGGAAIKLPLLVLWT